MPNVNNPSGQDTSFHREAGKPRVDLLQWGAILAVGQVAEFGAKKYGDRNFEQYAQQWNWGQLFGSAIRHLIAWAMREDRDPESGLHHLAHAAWNILTLLDFVMRGLGNDDRTTVLTKDSIQVGQEADRG